MVFQPPNLVQPPKPIVNGHRVKMCSECQRYNWQTQGIRDIIKLGREKPN